MYTGGDEVEECIKEEIVTYAVLVALLAHDGNATGRGLDRRQVGFTSYSLAKW